MFREVADQWETRNPSQTVRTDCDDLRNDLFRRMVADFSDRVELTNVLGCGGDSVRIPLKPLEREMRHGVPKVDL